MKVCVLGFALLSLLLLPAAGRSALAIEGQNVASETYYHLDVDGGRIEARLEAEVQAQSGELDQVVLFAMPLAEDISVTHNGEPLGFERIEAAEGAPLVVDVELPGPLRGKLTRELVMTYTVPTGETELTSVAPGAIETMFVSQGAGSFVLIDVPVEADNVLDPGCLYASDQPGEVSDAGYERWVCGDAALVALNTEDQRVQDRCASMNDRCRQSLADLPFSAFAQSVTDPELVARLKENVAIGNGQVPLELKHFAADSEWAQAQFDVAREALPQLEALFGFPYPNEQVLLRQSHHIDLVGAAGLAFTDRGEMLIVSGSGADEYVTVHELAHQWAGRNLETSWLWEGLAEWAARTIAPGLGVDLLERPWEALGHDDPLATWHSGSAVVDANYWYGKSGDFFFAYEEAIGGRDNMTAVLGQLDDDPSVLPADGRWFMDVGEDVSGANLDGLFLEWVWNEASGRQLLETRRAAHDLVDGLVADAAAVGLTGVPSGIRQNLRDWSFGPIASQVEEARGVLGEYEALVTAASDQGLALPDSVTAAWSSQSLSDFEGTMSRHRQALDLLAMAGDDLAALDDTGHPAHGLLADANVAFAGGDVDSALSLSAEAREAVYNVEASERMIGIAEQEQAAYSENFVRRIGLFGSDPAGDLQAAHAAFAAGEFAEALGKSRAAYDAWNSATGAGYMRLGVLAGLLCGLSVLVWWLLTRLDRGDDEGRNRGIHDRHHIEEEPDKHRSRWRDWENTP